MTPQLWIAFGLTTLLVVFLMVAFFTKGDLKEAQRTILRFLCALCAGFAGGLFVGEALFKMDTTGPVKFAVSGGAGFALFFAVWYGFGKYVPSERVAADGFAFSVAPGWTFGDTALRIAQVDQASVDFGGLTTAEREQALEGRQLQVRSPLDALVHLRALAPEGTIRPYDVALIRPTYRFRLNA